MFTEAGRGHEGAALRGSAWLALINVLSKGASTLVTLVLAVLLDEREMGLAAYAATLINIGVVIETVGVHDVIARTERGRRRMAGTVQSLSVLVALVTTAGVLLVRNPLATWLGAPDAGGLLALVAVSLPLFALSGAQIGLAHSSMQFRRRLAPDLASAAISAIVTLASAAAGYGAYALAFGILAGAAAQPTVGMLVGLGVGFAWDRACAREAMQWIRVVAPGAVIAVFLVNVDYVVVGAVLGPADLGQYSLAFRVIWIPYVTLAVAIAATSFPLYVHVLHRDGDHAPTVREISHLAIVVLGGIYLVIALLAPHIVVLGSQWAPSASVIVALAPYGFLLAITLLWCEAIRAASRPDLYLALQLVYFAATVVLLVVLTPHGILWTAMGQSVVTLALGVLTFLAMRRSGVHIRLRGLGRPLSVLAVGGLLAAAASWVVSSGALALSWSPLASLAVDLPGTVLVYVAVVGVLDRRLLPTLRAVRAGGAPTRGATA